MPNNWIKSIDITDNDVCSWVNHTKNKSVVVEELGGKYAIFLIDMNNGDIIEEIGKGIKDKDTAIKTAKIWLN